MKMSTTVLVRPVISYKAALKEKLYQLTTSGANEYSTAELNEIKILMLRTLNEMMLETIEAAVQQWVVEVLNGRQ